MIDALLFKRKSMELTEKLARKKQSLCKTPRIEADEFDYGTFFCFSDGQGPDFIGLHQQAPHEVDVP